MCAIGRRFMNIIDFYDFLGLEACIAMELFIAHFTMLDFKPLLLCFVVDDCDQNDTKDPLGQSITELSQKKN